jgi:ubiquinone/menaquinone biosynthesis C-methylase UbiE
VTSFTRWLWSPYILVETLVSRPWGPLGHVTGFVMANTHGPLTRWAIEHLDVRPSDRVLEVGCGAGGAIARLVRLAPEGFVAGVDRSKAMVRQARLRNRSAVRRGRAEVRHGTVTALPHPDASFDRAIAIETLYYWGDAVAGLREIRRVLKPGGRLVVALEMSREGKGLASRAYVAGALQRGQIIPSGEELVAMMRAAGFREARYDSEPAKGLGWLCAVADA